MSYQYSEGIYADIGCKDAKSFLGYSTTCLKCPFGDCIRDLKYREKLLILQSNTIENIIVCFDLGMTPNEIAKLFKPITARQIKQWLSNRDKIIKKIKKYAPTGVK